MTDARLAQVLATAMQIAEEARQCWETTSDLPDKDAVLIVKRHATALQGSLEQWIAKRALRAQWSRSSVV